MDPILSAPLSQRTVPVRKSRDASNPAQERPILPTPPLPKPAPAAAAPVAAPEQPTAQEGLCPKCSAKLINPEQLGWCPKCGYCRSLQSDTQQVTEALRKPSLSHRTSVLGVFEFVALLKRVAPWAWVLIGGIVVLIAGSVAAHFWLPGQSLPRAIVSTSLLVVGVVAIFAAQVWALIVVAPHEDGLGVKDLFYCGRLWKLTLQRLPKTYRQTWMGGWSLTGIACAIFVIGNLDYWFLYYQPKKVKDQSLMQAVAALKKDNGGTLEEAVEDFANMQDLTKKEESTEEKPKLPEVNKSAECVIIGFILDNRNRLEGLAVATLVSGKLTYAGVVHEGFTLEYCKELQKRLPPLVQKAPPIEGLALRATWVKPEVYCEVSYKDLTEQKHLKEPVYKGILEVDE